MPHIHTTVEGFTTSIDTPTGENFHFHTVVEVRTTEEKYGTGHQHTFKNALTSGPLELPPNFRSRT